MAAQDPLKDLELLIKSRYGLVILETREIDRAGALLRHLADRLDLPYFSWSRTQGLQRDGSEAAVYGTTEPAAALGHVSSSSFEALYHFQGLGPHLRDEVLTATLVDAGRHLSDRKGAVVISGDVPSLPDAVHQISATVQLPGPAAADFRQLIREIIRDVGSRGRARVDLEPADLDRLLSHLAGLTLTEAEKILTKSLVEDGRLDIADIQRVIDHKKTMVEREGLLEYYPAEAGMADIADLAGLKGWLEKRRQIITDPRRARDYGLEFPKGVLLLGVPGCGKSLCARAVAREWQLPLLKLDPSNLYSKYIGESEQNFRRAMTTAESMAPVVLWIDEVEKAFSSANSDEDGGTSQRIFGTFLAWLQDRNGDVFIVATANDVSRLPPEFLRKGRFDEIFFVDLPSSEARRAILHIHLRKRQQDSERFDLARLTAATEGFTGAEIEQVIVSSLYTAFSENRPLAEGHLLREISLSRPLSRAMGEKVTALRQWASERTVKAN